MASSTLPPMVVLLENDRFALNVALLNTGKNEKRTFGREVQNNMKAPIVTPKPKKQRLRSGTISPKRDRAVTRLNLPPAVPQLSREHQRTIIDHLITTDTKCGLEKDYMASQADINGKMRAILIDWLVEVCVKFELMQQVLPQTVMLIDRYLQTTQTQRTKLQLVGVACLMIIAKFEEVYPPMLKDYLSVCDNAYTKAELLKMESEVVQKLGFQLIQPTALGLLTAYQGCLQTELKNYYFAQYILEVALLDLASLRHRPSVLAAAAMFFVNKIFKHKEGWPTAHQTVTGYQEEDLKLAAKDLFVILQRSENGDLQAVCRKFGTSEYLEVSSYTVQKKKQPQQQQSEPPTATAQVAN